MPLPKVFVSGKELMLSTDRESIAAGDWCYQSETGELFQCVENHIQEQDAIVAKAGKVYFHGHDPFVIYKVLNM